MNLTPKIYINSIIYVVILIFVSFFIGSGLADNSNSVKIAKDSERQNGSPSFKSAHGYRAKFKFRYYPRCRVYYDASRKVYFYLQGENWEVGISLPSDVKGDLGEYVSLELDTERPYLYNEVHNNKYSSKQLKSEKRQINFFTKLWILLFAR